MSRFYGSLCSSMVGQQPRKLHKFTMSENITKSFRRSFFFDSHCRPKNSKTNVAHCPVLLLLVTHDKTGREKMYLRKNADCQEDIRPMSTGHLTTTTKTTKQNHTVIGTGRQYFTDIIGLSTTTVT